MRSCVGCSYRKEVAERLIGTRIQEDFDGAGVSKASRPAKGLSRLCIDVSAVGDEYLYGFVFSICRRRNECRIFGIVDVDCICTRSLQVRAHIENIAKSRKINKPFVLSLYKILIVHLSFLCQGFPASVWR